VRRTQVDSESIASVGYEDDVLEVRFRNGGIYRYFGVPEDVHYDLMTAGSKGRFFNREIRDAYRAERVRRAGPMRVIAAASS
jgi:hypothetical protein